MSWHNFLTSLILAHREIPVEHKLMTCLPKAFPLYSPFSFSSRCLYQAYVLFMTSSLALPTLPCVHLCPNLPLFKRPFKYSRFLCCSMPSFGVSTISLKKSSFNISSTSTLIFIKRRNRQHMKLLTLLGRTSSQVFVMLVFLLLYLHFVVVSSFVDVLHFVVVHSHFLFDVIPHPSVDYRRGFYTTFYFILSTQPTAE